jgi:hypothetical protein
MICPQNPELLFYVRVCTTQCLALPKEIELLQNLLKALREGSWVERKADKDWKERKPKQACPAWVKGAHDKAPPGGGSRGVKGAQGLSIVGLCYCVGPLDPTNYDETLDL